MSNLDYEMGYCEGLRKALKDSFSFQGPSTPANVELIPTNNEMVFTVTATDVSNQLANTKLNEEFTPSELELIRDCLRKVIRQATSSYQRRIMELLPSLMGELKRRDVQNEKWDFTWHDPRTPLRNTQWAQFVRDIALSSPNMFHVAQTPDGLVLDVV